MPRRRIQLTLSAQECAALSAALHTLLKLWGDSEDAGQERIHAKLRSVAEKLEALDSQRTDAASKRDPQSIATRNPLIGASSPFHFSD